jgi:hypothetical protein
MDRRFSTPSKMLMTRWPASVTGVLALGVALFSACDLSYPTSQWDDPSFDHLEVSGGFDLIGVHETALCSGCHDPSNYAPKYDPADEMDCVACHQAEYDETHAPAGYPTTCTLCHTPTDWGNGSFDHAASSGGFDLWGPHLTKPCTVCHDAVTWAPKFDPANSRDCGACH